jgi:hypothetical protein
MSPGFFTRLASLGRTPGLELKIASAPCFRCILCDFAIYIWTRRTAIAIGPWPAFIHPAPVLHSTVGRNRPTQSSRFNWKQAAVGISHDRCGRISAGFGIEVSGLTAMSAVPAVVLENPGSGRRRECPPVLGPTGSEVIFEASGLCATLWLPLQVSWSFPPSFSARRQNRRNLAPRLNRVGQHAEQRSGPNLTWASPTDARESTALLLSTSLPRTIRAV